MLIVDSVQYHYSMQLEQESAFDIPDHKPKADWPSEGQIEIKDIRIKYRPELPEVLKGLTMSINPGEKVGIVGR